MKKRDKLFTKTGLEIDCNIIGFMDGISGNKIIIYSTYDNEKELLASYFNLDDNKLTLNEIESDEEWDNIEKEFKKLEEKLKKNKVSD